MRCPICKTEFIYNFDYRSGSHCEHECPCGQLLQWDYPIAETTRPGRITVGPPKPCEHEEFKRPGAVVPID